MYYLGGRLRIRYYSSQVVSEPKYFTGLAKKDKNKYNLHIVLIRFIIVQKQKYSLFGRHHHTKRTD